MKFVREFFGYGSCYELMFEDTFISLHIKSLYIAVYLKITCSSILTTELELQIYIKSILTGETLMQHTVAVTMTERGLLFWTDKEIFQSLWQT